MELEHDVYSHLHRRSWHTWVTTPQPSGRLSPFSKCFCDQQHTREEDSWHPSWVQTDQHQFTAGSGGSILPPSWDRASVHTWGLTLRRLCSNAARPERMPKNSRCGNTLTPSKVSSLTSLSSKPWLFTLSNLHSSFLQYTCTYLLTA